MRALFSMIVVGVLFVALCETGIARGSLLDPIPYPSSFAVTIPQSKGTDAMAKVDAGLRLLYQLYTEPSTGAKADAERV